MFSGERCKVLGRRPTGHASAIAHGRAAVEEPVGYTRASLSG